MHAIYVICSKAKYVDYPKTVNNDKTGGWHVIVYTDPLSLAKYILRLYQYCSQQTCVLVLEYIFSSTQMYSVHVI